MVRKNRWLAGSVLGLMLAGGSCFGQDAKPQDTAKRLGDKFDSAVQNLKRGAREAEETVQQQYERARTAVHNMSVSGRVYARLHWDKELQGAKIEVDVKDEMATLRGSVLDAKAKAKAVQLAADTVGVNRVNDQLTVPTAETPAQTPATTAPKR